MKTSSGKKGSFFETWRLTKVHGRYTIKTNKIVMYSPSTSPARQDFYSVAAKHFSIEQTFITVKFFY